MVTVWSPRTFATAAHSLSLLRSNADGVAVTIVTSHVDRYSPALAAGDVRLMEPDLNDLEWVDWALQVCQDHQVDVLWPTRRLEALSAAAARFREQGTRVLTCAPSAHQAVASKSATYRLAQRLELPVPPHVVVRTREQAQCALHELSAQTRQPLLVKPDAGQGGEGVYLIADAEPAALPRPGVVTTDNWLQHLSHPDNPPREWIVMPYLPGKEHSVDLVLSTDGDLRAAVVRSKDDASRAQIAHHDGDLVDMSLRLVCAAELGPLVNVQWREMDGARVLLETNPRAAAGLYRSSRSLNVDLLWLAISDSLGWTRPAGTVLMEGMVELTSLPDSLVVRPTSSDSDGLTSH